MASKNSNPKILLVEDDDSISEMYKMKFEREGYQIILLKEGKGVLEKIKQEKPNMVLLDIILPQENGFDILEELKQDTSTKNIPVFMLTNLGQQEDIDKGKQLGADGYIVKANTTPSQVLEKIKNQLK